MNRTKIEWTEWTWNPVVGCDHGCWYCYAKKIAIRFKKNFPNGFKPTFYPERLDEPIKLRKPSKIFCCSISDLFADWTKPEWRDKVLSVIQDRYLIHTFQLLTKQPQNINKNYNFTPNIWIGATVTTQEEIDKIEEIKKIKCRVKFISFEPLLSHIDCDLKGIDWIIIGKLTGSKRIKLQSEWVENIIKQAEKLNIPIFLKNNLRPIYKGKLIQEFPMFWF